MVIDLLIHNAAELLAIPGPGPKRGPDQGDLGIIPDGAVAVVGGRILAVGPTTDLLPLAGPETRMVDATGRVVLPGFVDAHTHAVFAGSREGEFEQRIQGATYLEIMAAGGGIMSTVRATRAASLDDLVTQSRPRLDAMLAHGTTTAEVKTGYGLDTANECKMLAAIRVLQATHPLTLVPTFLGAHAVPTEYAGKTEAYVDLIVEEMLPAVSARPSDNSVGKPVGIGTSIRSSDLESLVPGVAGEQARAIKIATTMLTHQIRHLPTSDLIVACRFADVFCEEGAFSLAQSRRILEAARQYDLGLKIHADEFTALGGAALAAELQATSADHLACTPPDQVRLLAEAGVVAVLLPGTTFGLGQQHYADARQMISLGLPVALGTDLNPGTCWCESLPLIIALACRYLRMTPAEAIVAATLNAACAVGLGDQVGSLEPGKQADMVVLDVPNHRHLGYRFGHNPVAIVVKQGRIVWP